MHGANEAFCVWNALLVICDVSVASSKYLISPRFFLFIIIYYIHSSRPLSFTTPPKLLEGFGSFLASSLQVSWRCATPILSPIRPAVQNRFVTFESLTPVLTQKFPFRAVLLRQRICLFFALFNMVKSVLRYLHWFGFREPFFRFMWNSKFIIKNTENII